MGGRRGGVRKDQHGSVGWEPFFGGYSKYEEEDHLI